MVKIHVLQIENRKDNNLILKMMKKNKQLCEERGIQYTFLEHSSFHVPPYWSKVFEINKILSLSNDNELYVYWIDSDAFFVNFDKLENLIQTNTAYSMIISKDMPPWEDGEFNAGSFLVKNDQMGRDIMQTWTLLYDATRWKCNNASWTADSGWSGSDYEQGSFIDHILLNKKYVNAIKQLPYYILNNNSCRSVEDTIVTHLAQDHKENIQTVAECEPIIEAFTEYTTDNYFVLLFVFLAFLIAMTYPLKRLFFRFKSLSVHSTNGYFARST